MKNIQKLIKDNLDPFRILFVTLHISDERADSIQDEFMSFDDSMNDIIEIYEEGHSIEISNTQFYLITRKTHWTKIQSLFDRLNIPLTVEDATEKIWNIENADIFTNHDSYDFLKEVFLQNFTIDDVLDRMNKKEPLNQIHKDILTISSESL